MFHILLNVFWKRAPIVHVCCQFHYMLIVRKIATDLFDEHEQSLCVSNCPIFANIHGHLNDVIKGKLSFNHFEIPFLFCQFPNRIAQEQQYRDSAKH